MQPASDDRRDHAPPRPARACDSPACDRDQKERPGEPEMKPEAVEIVDEPGLVGDDEQVVRALDAAEGRRVVEERRQETQHDHSAGEGNGYGDALLPGGQPAAGIGEHRPGSERRAGREQDETDREDDGRAHAGVVPLGEKPGTAGRCKERADGVRRPPPPEDEAAGKERPAGAEQGRCAPERRAGEGERRPLASERERDGAEREPGRPEGEPKQHVPIVAQPQRNACRAAP